jgi:hypothetical protein
MRSRIPGTIACAVSLLALTGCALPPARSSHDRAASQGVVIGTVTIGARADSLAYVYVDAPAAVPAEAQSHDDSGRTRVVLTNKPLSAADLARLREATWPGNDRVRGVLIDIGADSKWETQFIEPSGLTGTYGFTSSGGKAGVADGRVRGRIAVSNQNEAGVRAMRVSFDAATGAGSALDADRARALAGRWRIAHWIGAKGQVHSGDFEFARQQGKTVARARIATAGTSYVADELFEVDANGEAVQLFGVVDPDARWVADELTLTLDSTRNKLSGTVRDTGGDTTYEVQLERVR